MNKEELKRLSFTLPAPLYEKIRKEAYVKKSLKGDIIRDALDEYFAKKK
jgi:hypothetical protein